MDFHISPFRASRPPVTCRWIFANIYPRGGKKRRGVMATCIMQRETRPVHCFFHAIRRFSTDPRRRFARLWHFPHPGDIKQNKKKKEELFLEFDLPSNYLLFVIRDGFMIPFFSAFCIREKVRRQINKLQLER